MPALNKFVAALRVGRTTSDVVLLREEEALVEGTAGGPGEPDRRRVVVGRDFPFLKKGTLTSSVVDIVVSAQQARRRERMPMALFC